MGNFKELRVWNDSIELAESIYRITRKPAFSNDFALCNQIRRAAISVYTNIAEGDERGANREPIHFFNIAKGSTAEIITQLVIAQKIGYINTDVMQTLENSAEKIRASLKKLIRSRSADNASPSISGSS